MLLPRALFPALSLFLTLIRAEDVPCLPSPSGSSSVTSPCQTADHSVEVTDRRQHLVSSPRGRFKRQNAGRGSLGGCENPRMSQIMKQVVSPLLTVRQMKLGDVAKLLQQAVQRATGKSQEIIMGKGEMMIASHQMKESTSCKMRIGDYYTQVYETPVKYNINDVAEETWLSNIDFGENLGGSGYPGQVPFPHVGETPLLQAEPLPPAPLLQEPLPPAPLPQALPPAPLPPAPLPPVEAPPVYGPYYEVPPAYYSGVAGLGGLECFSGDVIVTTSEGPKLMSELKRGDEVLSLDQNSISFSPIIMFLHRDEELLAEFNVITTANGDTVKLTNEHLIYVSDCGRRSSFGLVRAKEVTTEHCLMGARSPMRKLKRDRVVNVTKTYERGIYAPLTATGDIIVNGVLSSCHSNLGFRTLQNSFFALYRSLSFLIPEAGELPLGLTSFTSALDLFIPVKAILV